MSLLHKLKIMARSMGLDIHRYNATESSDARLCKLIAHHGVDAVLDVGANDGGYGRLLREAGYKGNILSFEPLEEAHKALVTSTASDDMWHVATRMALGDKDGETVINVAGNSTSSSILPMMSLHEDAAPQSKYIATQRVPIMRLDRVDHMLLSDCHRMLLKIDTQGYERQVLDGAENIFNKIQGIQLELSLVPLYDGQCLYREIIEYLLGRGFELWNVLPGFVDYHTGRMLQVDGVFFKH